MKIIPTHKWELCKGESALIGQHQVFGIFVRSWDIFGVSIMVFMLCIWIFKKKSYCKVCCLICEGLGLCLFGFFIFKDLSLLICFYWKLREGFFWSLGVVLMSYLHALKCDQIWLNPVLFPLSCPPPAVSFTLG